MGSESMPDQERPITLAITGASGSIYGLRLLECLIQSGRRVYLLISRPGKMVVADGNGARFAISASGDANSVE